MIETKFKHTEIGLIPHDWEVIELKEGLVLLTDYDANGSFADMANNVETYTSPNYAWYVRATDLEQNTPISQVHYTDEKSYKFLRKSSLYGGEVLVAKRGDIGKVYYFTMKTEKATLGPNLYLLKLNNKLDSAYLYYHFKSAAGQKKLKSINASTSLGAIYKDDVKSLIIPIPPTITEQERIADALSKIDNLITDLDALIDKKRAIKTGTMQQLLTSKKRLKGFTEEWKEKKLCDIIKVRNGYPFQSSTYSDIGTYKIITIANVQNGRLDLTSYNSIGILPQNIQSYQILKIDDILVSMTGNVGRICKVSEENCLLNQRVGLLQIFSKDIDVDFLYVVLNNIDFEQAMIERGQGAAQSNISNKDIEGYSFIIPPTIEEQNAIASILSSMDTEIAALEQKRDKYIAIKQGMMQNLLTGKIRLV